MYIDLSMKITEDMLGNASKNESKTLKGHLGTHFDVMDKVFELEYLKTKGVVFDVSKIKNRQIDITDIDIDKVQKGMFILFYTGFIEKVSYGSKEYFTTHPELSHRLIEALLAKKVAIIGVDFAGIRRGSEHTVADQHCADNGVFVVENLCNVGQLLGKDNIIINTYPINSVAHTGLMSRVVAEV